MSLGLLRSDYMVHSSSTNKIKQVEINTIASSFAGIATKISIYNRYDFCCNLSLKQVQDIEDFDLALT